MDEKDYELLHALDETRNITHAADKLYMTQSALSKRIKALEQELGVEIVLRSRQGIRFTPAGEQVLLHSAAAAREMVERGLGWALMPEVALDNFKGYVKPCTFENGEPFVRRTYIFCQRDAAALPQVQLFMDMLKKHR